METDFRHVTTSIYETIHSQSISIVLVCIIKYNVQIKISRSGDVHKSTIQNDESNKSSC